MHVVNVEYEDKYNCPTSDRYMFRNFDLADEFRTWARQQPGVEYVSAPRKVEIHYSIHQAQHDVEIWLREAR